MFNNPTSAVLCSLFLILMVVFPVAIAYLPFLWFKKKGYKKIGLVLLFGVFVLSAYATYVAFYPRDAFYKDEFKSNTNIPFPKSGVILARGASYPDMHGDYSAGAIVKMNADDFEKINTAVQTNSDFKVQTPGFHFGQPFDKKPTQNISPENFTEVYILSRTDRDLIFIIGFDKDDGLISFERDSW
jgi:hypothetical protein